MKMIEVVAQKKGKPDTCKREALIGLANLLLYTDIGRMLEYRHISRDPKYKDT